MRCPFCGANKDKVIDSRSSEGGTVIRRRRTCLSCNKRFTTYERIEESVKLSIIKKDGTREPYDRQKLSYGLQKALFKRNIEEEDFNQLIENIEDELFRTKEKEVVSNEIGEIAAKYLKHVDQVAYVRFASVYKEFRDLDDLMDVVKEMAEVKKNADAPGQGKLF